MLRNKLFPLTPLVNILIKPMYLWELRHGEDKERGKSIKVMEWIPSFSFPLFVREVLQEMKFFEFLNFSKIQNFASRQNSIVVFVSLTRKWMVLQFYFIIILLLFYEVKYFPLFLGSATTILAAVRRDRIRVYWVCRVAHSRSLSAANWVS